MRFPGEGMIMRSGASSFRFTHLLVRNWRNFLRRSRPGGRVVLAGRAERQDNLLDVFRFLCDLALPRRLQERCAAGACAGCAAWPRGRSRISRWCHAATPEPAACEYELQFNQEGQHPPWSSANVELAGEDVVDVRMSTTRRTPAADQTAWSG